MKTNTLLISTLALALMLAPAALQAQEYEEPATTAFAGCLQPNADGTGYVLVDEASGSEIALEGGDEELAAAAGNNVTVTGTPSADAEGNPVLQVESVEDSGEACAATEEEPMEEEAPSEYEEPGV